MTSKQNYYFLLPPKMIANADRRKVVGNGEHTCMCVHTDTHAPTHALVEHSGWKRAGPVNHTC